MDWQRYQQAMALEENGKAEEALTILRDLEGAWTDPAESAAWFVGMANCLRLLHQYDQAREVVARAYKVLDKNNPSFPELIFADVCIDEDVGNWKKALKKLDLILERYRDILKDPENESFKKRVFEDRGCALVNLKRYAEARKVLESAQADGFSSYRPLFYLGACCYSMGDLAACKRHMSEALAFDLDSGYSVEAHYYLGLAHLRLGECAWAKQEFEWCFQHEDQSTIWKDAVITGLVKASEALGLKEEARKYSAMLGSRLRRRLLRWSHLKIRRC